MKSLLKYSLVIIMIAILIISGYLFRNDQQQNNMISAYNNNRDRSDVIELFKANWDWLVAGLTYSKEYVENILDKRTPNRNPFYIGALHFKVLRVDNKVVGFTAYYMKEKNLGWLLFLVIDEQYRGKGYADMLTKDAIQELENMGATKVRLLTRSTNIKAQHLYRRLGFHEYAYDPDGFVYFEIIP